MAREITRKSRKIVGRELKANRISLRPLDFETAVAAAMATGKPPKAKAARKKAGRRAKK
jgi:hypothetical protein